MTDESLFSIREFTDTDFEAFAAIHNAVRPEAPTSPESLRHEAAVQVAPGTTNLRYAVELRRTKEVVGVGGLSNDPNEADLRKFWIFLFVASEMQGRGVGSRLFDALTAEATRRHAKVLRAFVREDELRGLAFLTKRGFAERRRSWVSELRLESADTSRMGPLIRTLGAGGVEISTLAREGVANPDVIEQVHRLDSETSVDEPRIDPFTPMPIDRFRRFFVEGPNALPDAWFIAKSGPRYVAMTSAATEPAEPGTLRQMYTCTRREHRRKGLALALKLSLTEYGKRHQYRILRTSNDSLNGPMWNLNLQLGFRKRWTWINLEKLLGVQNG